MATISSASSASRTNINSKIISEDTTIDIEFMAEHMKPSVEVLKFYRRKVLNFEKERADFLQRLADVEVCIY